MTKYVGLDRASKGWFGVVLEEDGRWKTDLFPSMLSLWKSHSDAERILVDAPIGLPADGRRSCDIEARQKLQQRHGTVFYTPTRKAVYRQNLDEARETNEAEAGFPIQNQAWSIVPRIREVDEFLDMYPGARDRLSETHPEMCFYGLNGRNALGTSKQTAEGIRQRKARLADEYSGATTIYEQSVARYTTPEYAPMVSDVENILDALAAAVTARRSSARLSSLPEDASPEDERGLPMQITYPTDVEQTRLASLGVRD